MCCFKGSTRSARDSESLRVKDRKVPGENEIYRIIFISNSIISNEMQMQEVELIVVFSMLKHSVIFTKVLAELSVWNRMIVVCYRNDHF